MPPPRINFILGLHRSGTTLLYQLLASTDRFRILTAHDVVALSRVPAPSVAWNGQTLPEFADLQRDGHVTRGIDDISLGPQTPEEYGFVLSNWHAGWSLSRHNISLFHQLCDALRNHTPDQPLLLKNPWDFGNAAFIHARLPTARFIFLHRNPWQTQSSTHRMMLEYLNHRNPYLAVLSEPYRRFLGTGFPLRMARWLCANRSDVVIRAAISRSVSAASRYVRQRPLLPAHIGLDLRFEDLCAHPQESLRRLFTFLEIDADLRPLAARIRQPDLRIAPELLRHRDRIQDGFAAYADALGYDLQAPQSEPTHRR